MKPEERPHLMAALSDRAATAREWSGVLELKRTAECLAPGLHVLPAQPYIWEHPARCAEIWWNGRAIGRLSELHPNLMEAGRAAVLDIDLTLLQELTPATARYTPRPPFPHQRFRSVDRRRRA